MNETQRRVILLALLVVVSALVYGLFPQLSLRTVPIPAASKSAPPAAPSAEVLAMLKKSHGFQALVSYTDRGFEPSTVSIKKGDTVRFINNSSEGLWVAATGTAGTVYPGTGKECGQSAFDVCKVLAHGQFWEFTFNATGSWSYQNNSDTAKTGVVRVQ